MGQSSMKRSIDAVGLALALSLLASCGAAELGGDELAQAQSAIEANDFSAARIHLINHLKANPEDGEARLQLVETFLRLGDGYGAQTAIEELPEAAGHEAIAEAHLAKALLLQGQFKKVVELSEGSKQSEYPEKLQWARASAYLALNQAEEAEKILAAALKENPEDFDLRLLDVAFQIEKGNLPRAKASFDAIDDAEKEQPLAQIAAGRIAVLEDRLDDAEKHFEDARKRGYENVPVYNALGGVYRAQGRNDDAREHFGKALELQPKNVQALTALAELELSDGSPQKALALVQQANADIVRTPRGLRVMGLIDLARGNHASAIDAFEGYLSRFGSDPIVVGALAEAYDKRGDSAQASKARQQMANAAASTSKLGRSISNQPERIQRQFAAINQQILAGNWDAANRLTDKLLAEGGDLGPTIYNNASAVKLKVGDKREAVRLAELAYKEAPQDPFVQDTLAWALLQSGKETDRAIGLLESAYKSNPGNAEIAWHFAQVLARSGERDAAAFRA